MGPIITIIKISTDTIEFWGNCQAPHYRTRLLSELYSSDTVYWQKWAKRLLLGHIGNEDMVNDKVRNKTTNHSPSP